LFSKYTPPYTSFFFLYISSFYYSLMP
jgi:hypothetical protein